MELKPCPFCGNETAITLVDSNESDFLHPDDPNWSDTPYWSVVCSMIENSPVPLDNWETGCGGSGGFRKTKEESIEAWNTRRGETNG